MHKCDVPIETPCICEAISSACDDHEQNVAGISFSDPERHVTSVLVPAETVLTVGINLNAGCEFLVAGVHSCTSVVAGVLFS